jgi:peptidoglycan/xylan/chitin deacetylase (PgdA/CDA1 family)
MTVYSKIRSSLSTRNQGRLTKFLVNYGIKPSVNKTVKSPFEKGIVVFSADFEMAWAFRFSKTKHTTALETGLSERENLPVLLGLFNRYNIPVTWATVGHLFNTSCSRGVDGIAHPEMPRPRYFEDRNWQYKSGDWYDNDPCTNKESDPAWYAPDLIEQIIQSNVSHEIGCHSFSHIDFTYKNCQKELANAELDACIKLAKEKGITLKSMVFPGGKSGNYESLKERGFTCYRKPMNNHIDLPYIDSTGLVVIPSSLGLDKDPYGWSKEFHLKMIRKFIEKTAKYKLVCHFWFHPSMDRWYHESVMPEVLRVVAEFRDASKIQVMTMGQLAEEVSIER